MISRKNLMTSKNSNRLSKKSCDTPPGRTPNIKMKLKSKVIRIIVYSKICILTQTHDDGKDSKRQKRSQSCGFSCWLVSKVFSWSFFIPECPWGVESWREVSESRVRPSLESQHSGSDLITVCESDSYCLAGGAVLLICNVMHTLGTLGFSAASMWEAACSIVLHLMRKSPLLVPLACDSKAQWNPRIQSESRFAVVRFADGCTKRFYSRVVNKQ